MTRVGGTQVHVEIGTDKRDVSYGYTWVELLVFRQGSMELKLGCERGWDTRLHVVYMALMIVGCAWCAPVQHRDKMGRSVLYIKRHHES